LNRSVLFSGVLVALLLILLSSCKSAQKAGAAAGPVTLTIEPAAGLFDKVILHEFHYNWFAAKTAVEYTDHNNDQTTFTVNLRAAKDSIIWLSVSPLLGIEAVRVLITRDSVYLLDRLHHVFITRDYRYLEDLLKTRVRFDMLQAILTGNYFSGIEGEKIISVYEESPYYILSTLPKLKELRVSEDKSPDHPRVQDFWVDTTYRIVKTRLEDDSLHRALSIEYTDFIPLGEKFFPKNILLKIEAAKPSRISIEYSKYSFDGPLNFPFSVPEKYSRE